jgi:hypothetical protein
MVLPLMTTAPPAPASPRTIAKPIIDDHADFLPRGLFVPAGVGVVQHLELLSGAGLRLIAVVLATLIHAGGEPCSSSRPWRAR